MKTISDPALYRKLSEPHADMQALEAAVAAFTEEVRAAREKHRIPEVLIICIANYLQDGGEEVAGMWSQHHGDSTKTLPMLAQTYGAEMEKHQERMDALTTPRRRK